MKFLLAEFAFFQSQNRNIRTLLMAMSLFFLTIPVQNAFSCAYILRQTHSVKTMIFFLMALYSAVPVASWINGLWMSRWGAERLFAFGVGLTGISMFALSLVNPSSLLAVSLVGASTGVSIGFVWVSHNYLVFISTTDESRNYFQSVELASLTFCIMIASFSVGWFVSRVGTPETSYLIVKVIALLLTMTSAALILRNRSPLPPHPAFVFVHYTPLAWKLFRFAFLHGLTQLFALCLPVLLVFCVIKENEFLLGKIQSLGALVAGLLLYMVGRLARPRHRIWLFMTSAIMYAIGACVNAVFQTLGSALFLIMALLFFAPLMDIAYTTLFLRAADKVALQEGRNRFTYIFVQEVFFYFGRLITLGMFLIAIRFSVEKLITVVTPILTLIHLFSIPMAWSLSKMEFSDDPQSGEKL